mmetsp:Transcript_32174/g.76479  ORF Transcript_32174/g.76479 Transcript_32174/m.76479 type:complete len:363 (-) Transcript_32174:42-1130(-)
MQGQLEVPGLGTVDVSAVREQLALLGHNVPDHIISAFLEDMATESLQGNISKQRTTEVEAGGLHTSEGREGKLPADHLEDAAEQDEPGSSAEILREERKCRQAHFEEAYYGQHDRHLWEAGRAMLDESSASLSSCGSDVDDELEKLRSSQAAMRNPMEVKNVWVAPRRTPGSSKDRRPATPQPPLPGRHGKGCQPAARPHEPRGQAGPSTRKNQSARGSKRPPWDGSAHIPRPKSASQALRGAAVERAQPKSNQSYIVASTGSPYLCGAAKKVDRVARNRHMAKTWKRDRFLQHGGAGQAITRPSENFHQYFSQQHAAAAAEREHSRRESQARTSRSLGTAQPGPHSKRRDSVRFEVRSRMT